MRTYSIHCLDAKGRKTATYMMPFQSDTCAVEFVGKVRLDHAIVEAWRENGLVRRLFRDAPAPIDGTSEPSARAPAALSRADVSRYAAYCE